MGMVLALCALVMAAPWLWERTAAERLKNQWKWACIAVQATQQTEEALAMLRRRCPRLDAELCRALIEAARQELR